MFAEELFGFEKSLQFTRPMKRTHLKQNLIKRIHVNPNCIENLTEHIKA